MYETEFEELNFYTLRASETVSNYYERLESLSDKDKQYLIEKILSELDIVLLWTMNLRHQLLQQMTVAPPAVKLQMSQLLNELKTSMETAKTLSFNFTAVYHGIRDKVKATIE